MEKGLRLYVLGTPILELDKRPLTADIISLKGQALLIYLAVSGRTHSRSVLAGLLWGDMSEENARANLRLTLSRLRKTLPDGYLHTTRLEVGLVDYWLDLALLQSPKTADLDSLCEQYRGDFLDGFELPNAAEFETWLLGMRQYWRQTAVSALYHHLETAVGQQQTRHGIRAAHKLLAIEPWHEESHRHLMQLLASDGQRSAALAQYEICRRLLADELGVAPAAETTALYEAIAAGQVSRQPLPSPPVVATVSPELSHNLPLSLLPLVGREAELERLVGLVKNGRYRLITVVGEGGVGKTRLALAAAEPLLPHFTAGVWLVPLAGLERADDSLAPEDRVASTIAAALGLNFAAGDTLSQQLANYLRPRQTLLILDNFEPLLDAVGLLRQLLTAAPQLTLLATSREPLRLQAEMMLRLEGLEVPAAVDWETAVAADSVTLFAERAERATGENLLTPANLPPIIALCRFVHGLPLGIELMAGWTRWLSLAAIANELPQQLLQMETALRDVADRHRSLQAVLAYSWRLLSPDEQQTLAQLSVFRGHFALEAVQNICRSRPATLFALIDKSLVQHQATAGYGLHDLVRLFAQAQLKGLAVDEAALRDRHATYYLGRMGARAAALAGSDPQPALQAIHSEADNLRRAWQWASERPLSAPLLAAVGGMGLYWNCAGLFGEGTALLAQAIGNVEKAGVTNGRLLAALWVEQATMLYELTRLAEMRVAAETAIRWSEQGGDGALVANGRLRLGQYFWRVGDHEAAADQLAQAEALAQQLGLTNLEGQIGRSLAANAWRQGDLAQAQRCGERSLRLHQQAGDMRSSYRSQFFLAILAQNQQRLVAARGYLEPMLAAARALGDRPAEAAGLSLAGQIAKYDGQLEQAVAFFQQEQQVARETGQPWQLASNLSNLGDVWLCLGQFARAEACYDEALQLLRQLGTAQAESNVLAYRGLLACWQGDFVNGRSLCELALQLAQQQGARREQAFAHLFLAHNLAGLGAWTLARQRYERAVQGWQLLGDGARQMEGQAGLVRSLVALGEIEGVKTAVLPLQTYLDNDIPVGASDPVLLYVGCWEGLTAVGDDRAEQYRQAGQAFLREQLARLQDVTLRHAFLHQIPSHAWLLADDEATN